MAWDDEYHQIPPHFIHILRTRAIIFALPLPDGAANASDQAGGTPLGPCRNVPHGFWGGGNDCKFRWQPVFPSGSGQASPRDGLAIRSRVQAEGRIGLRTGPVADVIALWAMACVPDTQFKASFCGLVRAVTPCRFSACRMRTSSGEIRAARVVAPSFFEISVRQSPRAALRTRIPSPPDWSSPCGRASVSGVWPRSFVRQW